MNTLKTDTPTALAKKVKVTKNTLAVYLNDGRIIVVPIDWFPRLLHGTKEERNTWKLIGKGSGIHWPHLDEDISVEGLLAGRASGESQRSINRWLEKRHPKKTSLTKAS